jgi:hypothetical protein
MLHLLLPTSGTCGPYVSYVCFTMPLFDSRFPLLPLPPPDGWCQRWPPLPPALPRSNSSCKWTTAGDAAVKGATGWTPEWWALTTPAVALVMQRKLRLETDRC